jgi:hypothetical protein
MLSTREDASAEDFPVDPICFFMLNVISFYDALFPIARQEAHGTGPARKSHPASEGARWKQAKAPMPGPPGTVRRKASGPEAGVAIMQSRFF